MNRFVLLIVSFIMLLGLSPPAALAQWSTIPGSQTEHWRANTDDGRWFEFYGARCSNPQGQIATVVSLKRSNYPGVWERRIITDKNVAELIPDQTLRGWWGGIGSILNRIPGVKQVAQAISRVVRVGAEQLQALSDYFSGLAKKLFGVADNIDKEFAGRYAVAATEVRALPLNVPVQQRVMEAIKRTCRQDASGRSVRLWGLTILQYQSE